VTPIEKPPQMDPREWGYFTILNSLAGKAAEIRARQGSGPGWVRYTTADDLKAAHETAHAVCCYLLLHRTVYEISIESNTVLGRGGHCISSMQPLNPAALEAARHCRVDSDRRKALKFCWLFCDPLTWWNARRHYRLLETHAAKFVNDHWHLIMALAHEALKYRTLNQEQIGKILGAPGLAATEWMPPTRCAESRAVQ
jgi:hypothetical protein